MSLSSTKVRILESCIERERNWRELLSESQVSKAVFHRNLHQLIKEGLLTKDDDGRYTTTIDGVEATLKAQRLEEAKKERLAARFIILQEILSPREVARLTTLKNIARCLLKRPLPLDEQAYEAYALANSLEIWSSREGIDLKVYDAAFNLVKEILRRGKEYEGHSCTVSVTFNLERGLQTVLERIRRDIHKAGGGGQRQKLHKLLEKFQSEKKMLMDDALRRFL